MALSQFERERCENAVASFIEKRRPAPHIRTEVDLSFRMEGQSVEIFEIRPVFRQPDKIMEHPIAKATFVQATNKWKVFWMRADLKWHRYGPTPVVSRIEDFVALVDGDQHACFFG